MPIITLTTDLGLKDYYVASIKGAILSQFSDANIIDITHLIPRFNIPQAAFIVRNAYAEFPPGTIHIVGVVPENSLQTKHVAIYYDQQYFIGSDTGIFSLIFDHAPEKIIELTLSQDTDLLTFPTKDIYVKAACHIARGGTLEIIGTHTNTMQERSIFRAVANESNISGTIIYTDSYGNIITNVTRQLFREVGRGRPFTIFFRHEKYKISALNNAYSDVSDGEVVALFGATGYMEIAINLGNASKLLGLGLNEIVRIEFES